MGRFVFLQRRLLQLVPVALGVTIAAFLMIHLLPGSPARAILGIHASPRAIAILNQQYGLTQPLAEQFWLFLGRIVRGDFGNSFYYGVPVASLIWERLPATLWLLGYSVVLAMAITVPLAMLAASKKDGVRDHLVRIIPLIGLGMPAFWIGVILIYLLAIRFRLFPVGGYGEGVTGHFSSMFLPALTVAIGLTPVLVRSLRASMLNVLDAEFITTARAKGVAGIRLFSRHVLRNAVIPTVTVLGINVGFLIGSTLVVENVFAIPGIGSLMISSIINRDFPVVQAVTLVFAVLVIIVNILTDLSYAVLDPRVRFD